MSDSPIFDEIDKPTPIYGSITGETPVQKPERKWYDKLLTKPVRRWAYGLTSAAVIAGSIWAGKPEFAVTAAPLLMALFYVDHNGEPKA